MSSSFDSDKNYGSGDQIISKCNVISYRNGKPTGKQLKDVSTKPWHAVTFTESMGLFEGHTQFLSGEIVIIDNVNLVNSLPIRIDDVVELTFKAPQKREIDFIG